MSIIKKTHRLFLLLTIPAILALFFNQSTNVHYHILNDGSTITHAHPYTSSTENDSPIQKHKHSALELIIISQLSNVLSFITIALAVFGFLFLYKKIVTAKPVEKFYISAYYKFVQLRAPPAYYLTFN